VRENIRNIAFTFAGGFFLGGIPMISSNNQFVGFVMWAIASGILICLLWYLKVTARLPLFRTLMAQRIQKAKTLLRFNGTSEFDMPAWYQWYDSTALLIRRMRGSVIEEQFRSAYDRESETGGLVLPELEKIINDTTKEDDLLNFDIADCKKALAS
jgi:hypothetical protein